MEQVDKVVRLVARQERLKELNKRLVAHATAEKDDSREYSFITVDSPYGSTAQFSLKGGVISESGVRKILGVIRATVEAELGEVNQKLEEADNILGGK